jgi:hypothetical protein
MNGPAIPEHIEKALILDEGYSKEFSDRVAIMGQTLSEHLGFPVAHDVDMNYRAGQSLSFSLLDRPPYTFSERGNREIKIFISSRSDLFCFVCPDERGMFVPSEKFPEPVQKIVGTCRNILKEMGFKEVENFLLNIKVPGFFTVLDNLPATLFQILFSEID